MNEQLRMRPAPTVEAVRSASARPAVVVAGLDLNGLGVVRSLARARLPVIALDTHFDKPTAATRFAQKVKVRALSGPQFLSDLEMLRSRFDTAPVLILTQEGSVETVSAARDRLEGLYRFSMPPADTMSTLMDKCRFQALAERLGFLVPRAVTINRTRGPEAVRDLRFPCVFKPACKSEAYANHFTKAYKVFSLEDVERLWAKAAAIVDEVIVQEWIEGTDSDIYFCLQYRSPTGRATSFVGRKTCQWPPLIGGTATCIPAPDVHDILASITDEFFSQVGFVGLGSMEFKHSGRVFYLIEPTVGRTDYQEEIATLNGVNLPLAAYFGELGMAPPAPTKPSASAGWRDHKGHANALHAGAVDRVREFAPRAKIVDAHFRPLDPMPYLALKRQAVMDGLRRRFRRASSP